MKGPGGVPQLKGHAGRHRCEGPCRAGGAPQMKGHACRAGEAPQRVMQGRWGATDEGPCRAGGAPQM